MNRRGFFRLAAKLAAVAGAVVGAGMVPKAAEASDLNPISKPVSVGIPVSGIKPDSRTLVGNAITGTNGYGFNITNAPPTGNGLGVWVGDRYQQIQPWPEPFTGTLGPGTYLAPIKPTWSGSIVGAGIDQTTIVHPPTFEAMQADCWARGCSFSPDGANMWAHTDPRTPDMESYTGSLRYYFGVGGPVGPGGPIDMVAVNEWRVALHERADADAFKAMVADCESRGCAMYDSDDVRFMNVGHGRPPLRGEPGWMWDHLPYEDGRRPDAEQIAAWRTSLHESEV